VYGTSTQNRGCPLAKMVLPDPEQSKESRPNSNHRCCCTPPRESDSFPNDRTEAHFFPSGVLASVVDTGSTTTYLPELLTKTPWNKSAATTPSFGSRLVV
jgi:hypothetical protein